MIYNTRFSVLLILFALCFTRTAAQFRTVIPYEEEDGKFIARVTVNGIPGRFLIDTGAPCSVSHTFAQKLGLQKGNSLTGTDSNGNELQTHLVMLDSLRAGGITFTKLQAVQWPQGTMVEQYGIDGIIGYNLMRMGIVRFDNRRHRMLFTNLPDRLGLDSLPYLPMLPDPYIVKVVVNLGTQQTDTVMFDCGASNFYSMRRPRYEALRNDTSTVRLLARGHGSLSMGAAGIEEASLKYRVCIPKMQIGQATFNNVVSITTDADDSRIGTDIMQFGEVMIDFLRGRFYYIPFDPTASPSLYYKDWDVVLTMQHGMITAGMIWGDGIPLQGGEQITEINGVRLTEPGSLRQLNPLPHFSMPGDTAQIKYVDKVSRTERPLTIYRR